MPAGLPLAHDRRRVDGRPGSSRAGPAGHRGGDHRHRRRPAADRLDRRRAGARHGDRAGGRRADAAGRARRPGRAPASASTWASTRRATPSGPRAATCAPRGWRAPRGRRSAPPLDIDPARRRRGASRPRVAVSAEGNAVVVWAEATPTAHRTSYSRRLTGLNALRRPAGPDARQVRGPGGRQRRLAGHRHRGRRLVRLGRVPPGLRRALAVVARRLRGSQYEAPFVDRRRADQRRPADRLRGQGHRRRRDRRGRQRHVQRLPGQVRRVPARRADRRHAGRPRRRPCRDLRARRRLRRLAHRPPARSARAARTARRASSPSSSASNPAFGAVAPGQIGIGSDRSGNTAVAMLQGERRRPAAHRRGLRPPARAARWS